MIAARSLSFRFAGVTRRTLAPACLLSAGLLLFAWSRGWPIWLIGGAAVAPWLPLFGVQTAAWTYQRYHWLALFYILVVTHTGHFLEHITQMIQLRVRGLTGADAQGIFGVLDIEWVHFVWNTWVLLAVVVRLARYGANRWLWLTALLNGWHEVEHAYPTSTSSTTSSKQCL